MNKKISVLIPCYNVEKYIERCLKSIFNNSIINDAEVIIVNDASPDNSYEICKKLISEYPNIDAKIVCHSENLGLGQARQTALENATGDYIICVDSDDWVEPDFLEELYTNAIQNNADVTGCSYFVETENKSIITRKELASKGCEVIKQILSGKTSDNIWNKLVKRQILIDNNLSWDPEVQNLEDTLICIKILSFANNVSYVDKPLYHYNLLNINSMSVVRKASYYEKALPVIDKIEHFLVSINKYELFKNEFIAFKLNKKYLLLSKGSISKLMNTTTFSDEEIYSLQNNYSIKKHIRKFLLGVHKKNYFISYFYFVLIKTKRFLKK